ncbi:hypothetical protein V4R08_14905 [Nitrobacter sp. NHB1]|uniref:hypothetical protein n=1 Tax=Nitrobacter sp. NHB1 TaxID=3119830 RepID=UPI002FFEF6D8
MTGALSMLFSENGLPDLPITLIEPHRNREGVWRIKFCYADREPLSMSSVQASTLADNLHQISETELADEIDDAVRSTKRYCSM